MKVPFYRAVGSLAPRFLVSFDSSSAMVRALSRFLKEKDFPGLGGAFPPSVFLSKAISALPRNVREKIYILGIPIEAISPKNLVNIKSEEISRWVVNSYPQRRYPAVMVGSASGAITHLAAALGIPWLPQTFLILARRLGIHPDEPRDDLEFGKRYADLLLGANPDIQLHQLHDPNQDRLVIKTASYFRIKRLTLGETYIGFLEESLEPGGTVFIVECERKWPTTKVDERYFFQFGALGGATEKDYFEGGSRVEDYLSRYGSHRKYWDPPEPDGERPEAEWGFEPALRNDIERLAMQKGYKIRRIVFEEPDHPSPLVADLYRWWYRERRMMANRLLAESFILMEPWWTLRTGSVPFWMKFNMEPSANWLEQYLDSTGEYDYINLLLFQHGVEAVGLPSIERWRSVTGRAKKRGGLLGIEEDKFPLEFGVYMRYHDSLRRIPARYPIPGPLHLSRLERFLKQTIDRYNVKWVDGFTGQGRATGGGEAA